MRFQAESELLGALGVAADPFEQALVPGESGLHRVPADLAFPALEKDKQQIRTGGSQDDPATKLGVGYPLAGLVGHEIRRW